MQRSGHVRLIAFFFLLAAGATAFGIAALVAIGAPRESGGILIVSVWSVAILGFAGVFAHRLTIAKARWKETQDYLARIQRASDRYRALMEGAADKLLVVEPGTGLIREANLRAREALAGGERLPAAGAAEGAAAGVAEGAPSVGQAAGVDRPRTTLRELVLPGDLERLDAAVREAATAGGPVSLSNLHLHGAGGRTIVVAARLVGIDLEGGHVVQLALRDVTRQKEMERQLAVHERLSSIGLLTAGVAHEINNPLEGIGNYLALLERPDLPPADRARYLELVRHGFARIGDIVRDLLRFARPKNESGTADVAGVVERALKLVRYTERFQGIEVSLDGLDRSLVVVGDAGRLEQLVFNLLLNAAQAMDGNGTIAIAARAERGAESGERELVLSVDDTGPGIAPEHLARLFDPFFSTSGGTGLGLSVSYGIARAHGGTLAAENRPTPGGAETGAKPAGARFVLRLPWPEDRGTSA
ncbi:MAG: hypothetical protein IPJ77_03225 [Planctomycetes bacterium]|nr:hypothetical protein [Planctomycetota bacterium]